MLLKLIEDLEHVAQIIGAGKAEIAIRFGRHGVERTPDAERVAAFFSQLGPAQVLAGNAEPFADELAFLLEYTVRAFADILDRDTRHLGLPDRKGKRVGAVLALLGSPEEQIVPIKTSQQKSDRQAQIPEDMVDLALGVGVRALVLPHQRGHPRVTERQPLRRVIQRRPDYMCRICGFSGPGDVDGLLLFSFHRPVSFHREYFRVVGHTEYAVRPGECIG